MSGEVAMSPVREMQSFFSRVKWSNFMHKVGKKRNRKEKSWLECFVWLCPILWKPQEPKSIWKDIIYSLFKAKIFALGVCGNTFSLAATLKIFSLKNGSK